VRFFLFVALAAAWFGVLGIRPLYKADESRYAEVSREMAQSGDWITPRLNGFKYFEKPPLQYWTTAFFFKALGEADWVARLWTALTGLAGICLVVWAGNRLFAPPAGLYAAAVLAASPLYVLLGQYNTLDMGLTFFLSAAIFGFALGHMWLFWAACALAVLSKGLVGIVLPLGAIALYSLLKRDFQSIKRIRPIAGPLLFLAIAAPWFIAVSAANDEFARFFFIREHFERFTTQVHQRGEPAWYFLPVLALGMGPVLLPVLWGSIRGYRPGPQALLVIWALVVLAFFSTSGSKLPSYILPAFPALAVLAGGWLASSNVRRVLAGQAALVLVAGGAIAAWSAQGQSLWFSAAGLSLAAAALAALFFSMKKNIPGAVGLIAIGAFAALQLAVAGHDAVMGERFSVASTVAALPGPPRPGARVFAVHAYDHTMPWVLRRTVTMVGGKDELEPSIAWEPDRFLPDTAAFLRAWQSAPGAYAFLDAAQFDARGGDFGVPMRLVARGPRYVLVEKP
jgi:4-amino-4-deoxy-L-arabinose transferase-like glycosyltransferase